MTKEKKTKSKESKIVDVVDTTSIEAATTVDGAGTINLQALQALGVDMKVTKADLFEYITTQVEEQLNKEKEEISSKMNDLVEAHNKHFNEKLKELESLVVKDPKFAPVVKAREALLLALKNTGLMEEDEDRNCISQKNIIAFKYHTPMEISNSNCSVLFFMNRNYSNRNKKEDVLLHCSISDRKIANVLLYSKEEFAQLQLEADNLTKQMSENYAKTRNISHHAKSAKMAMLRSILGDSKEGKTLLGFLDSRGRNLQTLKA